MIADLISMEGGADTLGSKSVFTLCYPYDEKLYRLHCHAGKIQSDFFLLLLENKCRGSDSFTYAIEKMLVKYQSPAK